MVTIILDYAYASPDCVINCIQAYDFKVKCRCFDIDEDCFEVHIDSYDDDNNDDVELAMMKIMETFIWR